MQREINRIPDSSGLRLASFRPSERIDCRLVLGASIDENGKICKDEDGSAAILDGREGRERTCDRSVPVSQRRERRSSSVERLDVLRFVLEREGTIRDCFGVSGERRGSASRSRDGERDDELGESPDLDSCGRSVRPIGRVGGKDDRSRSECDDTLLELARRKRLVPLSQPHQLPPAANPIRNAPSASRPPPTEQ